MIIYCYNKRESPRQFDVSKSMLIGVEGGIGGVRSQSICFSSLLSSSVGGRWGGSGGDALSVVLSEVDVHNSATSLNHPTCV